MTCRIPALLLFGLVTAEAPLFAQATACPADRESMLVDGAPLAGRSDRRWYVHDPDPGARVQFQHVLSGPAVATVARLNAGRELPVRPVACMRDSNPAFTYVVDLPSASELPDSSLLQLEHAGTAVRLIHVFLGRPVEVKAFTGDPGNGAVTIVDNQSRGTLTPELRVPTRYRLEVLRPDAVDISAGLYSRDTTNLLLQLELRAGALHTELEATQAKPDSLFLRLSLRRPFYRMQDDAIVEQRVVNLPAVMVAARDRSSEIITLLNPRDQRPLSDVFVCRQSEVLLPASVNATQSLKTYTLKGYDLSGAATDFGLLVVPPKVSSTPVPSRLLVTRALKLEDGSFIALVARLHDGTTPTNHYVRFVAHECPQVTAIRIVQGLQATTDIAVSPGDTSVLRLEGRNLKDWEVQLDSAYVRGRDIQKAVSGDTYLEVAIVVREDVTGVSIPISLAHANLQLESAATLALRENRHPAALESFAALAFAVLPRKEVPPAPEQQAQTSRQALAPSIAAFDAAASQTERREQFSLSSRVVDTRDIKNLVLRFDRQEIERLRLRGPQCLNVEARLHGPSGDSLGLFAARIAVMPAPRTGRARRVYSPCPGYRIADSLNLANEMRRAFQDSPAWSRLTVTLTQDRALYGEEGLSRSITLRKRRNAGWEGRTTFPVLYQFLIGRELDAAERADTVAAKAGEGAERIRSLGLSAGYVLEYFRYDDNGRKMPWRGSIGLAGLNALGGGSSLRTLALLTQTSLYTGLNVGNVDLVISFGLALRLRNPIYLLPVFGPGIQIGS